MGVGVGVGVGVRAGAGVGLGTPEVYSTGLQSFRCVWQYPPRDQRGMRPGAERRLPRVGGPSHVRHLTAVRAETAMPMKW